MSAQTGTTRARTRLRLTRRGRALVTGASALLVVIAALLAWVVVSAAVAPGASAGDGTSPDEVEVVEVVVEPGDTLWSIAAEYTPDEDPREVASRITRYNDLGDNAVLQPGDQLAVPVE